MQTISQFYNFQLSPVVRWLIYINFFVWFALVVVLQSLFFKDNQVFHVLGLVPSKVFDLFWLWQSITYMFIHSPSAFHILFNMFALWMFGSELERLWGSKFFLTYYLTCGFGAGLIYLITLKVMLLLGYLNPVQLVIPMVGASGAIFGILFAYGLIFSERIIYFMMIFPMKALHFTFLIAMIEFVSLINSGIGSSVSHLAHLSGFITGFLFLQLWKKMQDFRIRRWRKGPVRLKILKGKDQEEE